MFVCLVLSHEVLLLVSVSFKLYRYLFSRVFLLVWCFNFVSLYCVSPSRCQATLQEVLTGQEGTPWVAGSSLGAAT